MLCILHCSFNQIAVTECAAGHLETTQFLVQPQSEETWHHRAKQSLRDCRGGNMKTILLIVSLAVAVLGQDKPRVGQDGRPLLNKPRVDMCKNRKYHEKYGKHHYFLSWREPWNKFEDWDWFNGRNFCRERCMDLVSFEDPEEYRHFAKLMHKGL